MSYETAHVSDSPASREKMIELLNEFKYVMLVTRLQQGNEEVLHSRYLQ